MDILWFLPIISVVYAFWLVMAFLRGRRQSKKLRIEDWSEHAFWCRENYRLIACCFVVGLCLCVLVFSTRSTSDESSSPAPLLTATGLAALFLLGAWALGMCILIFEDHVFLHFLLRRTYHERRAMEHPHTADAVRRKVRRLRWLHHVLCRLAGLRLDDVLDEACPLKENDADRTAPDDAARP